MREVAAIGVGMTKWGELWKKSLRDVYVETALLALEDAGVDKIDSMYVGSMTPGLFVGQEHIAAMLADYLGQAPVPSARFRQGRGWAQRPCRPRCSAAPKPCCC